MSNNTPKLLSPQKWLSQQKDIISTITEIIDINRILHQKSPSLKWDQCCYYPMPLVLTACEENFNTDLDKDLAVKYGVLLNTVMAIWKKTQGIYRFDLDIETLLVKDCLISDRLPTSLLTRLPEWCVYIESSFLGVYKGFWATITDDIENENPYKYKLIMLFDPSFEEHSLEDLKYVTLPLVSSFNDSLHALHNNSLARQLRLEQKKDISYKEVLSFLPPIETIKTAISLLLYLCSEEPDIINIKKQNILPRNPKPTKVKSGLKVLPANHPTIWNVGQRLGAELRHAQTQHELQEKLWQDSSRNSPRPHIRRAHWHAWLLDRIKSQQLAKVYP